MNNKKSITSSVFKTLIVSSLPFASIHLVAASETDQKIESAFVKTYVYQTFLHDDAIVVRSSEGQVDLSGTVADESHKALAEETVANLPGVTSVSNHLSLINAGPSEHSDQWIQYKVGTALLFHKNVSALNTKVSVVNGNVTLRGKAENQAQKELATEYVSDVPGVLAVKNEMAIEAPSKSLTKKTTDNIDDASITAQVKMSLLSHRSTSAIKTHVKTQNGDVTLTGEVENPATKDLVNKLASDINGVKKVHNKLTIKK